jgi:hypothetical protein
MMMAQGGVSLPAGYTKLEYLESDGTNYIDTGFAPNQDTRIVCDFQYVSSADWQILFGVENGTATENANLDAYIFAMANYQGNYFHFYYGESAPSVGANITSTSRWTVDLNKNVMTIGGESYTAESRTFQSNYSLSIFTYNQAGTQTLPATARIYSCLIYDNGVKVRDYIPCTSPDGVSGLYDLVNDVFYPLQQVVTKLENKLTLSSGIVTSQYPVASELTIIISMPFGTSTKYTMSKFSSSMTTPTYAIAITSISPTEDDTYIYTF